MASDEINDGDGEVRESRQKLVFTGLCIDLLVLIPESIAVILS